MQIRSKIKSIIVLIPESKIIRLACLLFCVIIGNTTFGQISDQSTPAGFGFSTKSAKIIPHMVLDSIHGAERIAQDKLLGVPNRYGVIQKLNIDIREKGIKTEMDDVNVWQYEISCPDALSLGVFFKVFYLPPEAKVFIYNPDKTQLVGGFTSENNKDGNQLAIAEFIGNSLIIEYDEPKNVEFHGELVIGDFSSAYLNFQSGVIGRVQINCPAGDDWQTEKHSVCLMTFHDLQYSYYCSGALINNVRNDGTPYFLTANHCISTNSMATTLVTYFNYENSTCTASDASLRQTLSGAKLVANSSYNDFSLLQLSEYPPKEYYPYFAGWNASSDQPTSGTCIHHPSGTPKCIAIDNDAPVSYNVLVQWDNANITQKNTHWAVSYETGADEGGSSGSPLFNSNRQVIGQLHGGDDDVSLFGKFSLSWNYSSSTSAQLKAWLDPDNTGTLRLDGLSYGSPPIAKFVADASFACLNTSVFLTDKSKNSPTGWLWQITPETFEFVNGTTANSQNPEIIFTTDGIYSITLVASNKEGSDIITQENLITAAAELPVEFSGFGDEITLCGNEFQGFQLIATGANEYSFTISEEDRFNTEIQSNTLILSLKDEYRQYGDFDTYVKVTGSHGDCSGADSILFHVQMPVNDDAQYAIALKLGRNASFSNRCGTVETNEPTPPFSGCLVSNNWCPPNGGVALLNNTVWFTFRGTSNRILTIQTEGFDTQMAVYEADSYSSLFSGDATQYTLLAANDNLSSSETSAIIQNLRVVPGKSYWLQVDGNNGDTGDLTINLLSNTIEAYPNPSAGIFHFTVSSIKGGVAELTVFSFTGQQILSKTEPVSEDSNTFDMDLSGMPAGFYLFRVNINGLIMTKKLILVK